MSLSSLGKIMRANCVYLRTTLIPLAVILVPCILIMGQLNLRYGARPLNIGENTVLKIVADNDVPLHDITVELSDGLQQSTPLLRIVQNNEINVKVEAVHSGEQTATVKFSDEKTCQIMIYVETTESKLSSGRYKSSVMNVLYPGNKPIKNDVPLQSITVNYAENMYSMFGWDTGWLVIFCCVSIFAGIILKLMGL